MATRTALLEVAINGQRSEPVIPSTPADVAAAARAAVAAGARVVHLHPRGGDSVPTLDADTCAATVRAVRDACPGIALSLSTWSEIEPDPQRRRKTVAGWTVLPELVTANQGEKGIVELCRDLIARGVGIEAGLLSVADAEAFVRSGLIDSCVRVLVEPLDEDVDAAVAHAAAMEDVLLRAGVTLPQVHHGDGVASWAVCKRALPRGHGIRTGMEDTLVLPDGRAASDNASLVVAAAELMREFGFLPTSV